MGGSGLTNGALPQPDTRESSPLCCVSNYTPCRTPHCVWSYTPCVLHTVCKVTHRVCKNVGKQCTPCRTSHCMQQRPTAVRGKIHNQKYRTNHPSRHTEFSALHNISIHIQHIQHIQQYNTNAVIFVKLLYLLN